METLGILMSKKSQGEKVIIEGILYKDGDKVSFKKDDIYNSKGGKEVAESTVTETVATETVSQATQSGIQAVVSQVQTHAATLGLGGCVAVTSGMGFQLEHTIDHSNQAVEKAAPYLHPRLASKELKVSGDENKPVKINLCQSPEKE